ncbi:hypothetical protein GCM10010213_10210 [Microbacterium maritypicum]|uniref:Uncharacterized protein n=1 Tax=Microbacterium maritypicum TaxID=33918 RepID=A0A4Y4B2W4_MICMQ|nr:hypothetical protein MLI01_10060 [Microbacterium liquefaciens]GGV53254.1 hypothetical protein GCM10010213_10210 [Microbacterium liquefaciens]
MSAGNSLWATSSSVSCTVGAFSEDDSSLTKGPNRACPTLWNPLTLTTPGGGTFEVVEGVPRRGHRVDDLGTRRCQHLAGRCESECATEPAGQRGRNASLQGGELLGYGGGGDPERVGHRRHAPESTKLSQDLQLMEFHVLSVGAATSMMQTMPIVLHRLMRWDRTHEGTVQRRTRHRTRARRAS